VIDLMYSLITKSSPQALLFLNFFIHFSISSCIILLLICSLRRLASLGFIWGRLAFSLATGAAFRYNLVYADDTVIMAESAADLQRQLDSFSDYCDILRLKVNVEKSKIVVFS
jgi:hypothetical protein